MPALLPPPFHVDLLVDPRSLLGVVYAAVDMLRTANSIAQLRHGEDAPPAFTWRLLGPDLQPVAEGVPPPYQGQPAPADRARRAVVIAPLHVRNIPMLRRLVAQRTAWAGWVGEALAAQVPVLAVSNGLWIAARSGALAGRRVALPWMYLGGFVKDFPDVTVEPEQALVRDGPAWSAATPGELRQALLQLMALGAGEDLTRSCASLFCFEPERQRTTAQAVQAERLQPTRDSTLARAIAWLGANLERPYRLEEVARAAAVSPRTLLRHFEQVLGHTPLEHLHLLRCRRACVLLEITLDSIPAVAEACGYSDPAAFRRVFRRHMGETPSRYRERFRLRASRSRWLVEARSEV